jgi:hypothetical protein
MDEFESMLETSFSLVYCLSTITTYGVGWNVDNGASSHMTFNWKIFNKFHGKEGGIQEELGNDATYPMTRMGIISFRMPLGDVLDLIEVLFVLGL